jgi:heat shock protein HtpX
MTPNNAAQPVLVYDRIAHNRRKTWLLVACAILALAPFILGISYAIAASIVVRVSPEARTTRAAVRQEEAMLKRLRAAGETRTEWEAELENRIAEQREKAESLQAENEALRWKLMPVAAFGLMAAMGILFWGMVSSPTSKLLVQAGAQAAGDREIEARRLLENLAIGAGLPVPKLYVIETSVPNAFAAGMSPDRAVVAVTRGALTLLDRRELEGVFAHELSHIGNQDIRLNTIVATIALFLRLPYLLFRRELASDRPIVVGRNDNRFGIWRLVASPFGIYVFFVAPVIAALIRAAVSREREFLADADAALLTRYPEGLLRALAKIGGAGSSVTGANPAFAHFYFANPVDCGATWFSRNLMATHPPIAERIQRLVGVQGETALAGLDQVVLAGRKFRDEHPIMELDPVLGAHPADELAALNQGNVMGRVYRVVSSQPVSVHDNPSPHSYRVAVVNPGALIVAFDDPGPMRQINTAGQTFGYISRKVRLKPMDEMIPDEVYDPKLRAAAEARLGPLTAAEPIPDMPKGTLSKQQLAIALGFGAAVFGAMLLLLMKLG